jgi:beta-glucosidase
MTLEEKIDQLHQGWVGDTNPNNLKLRESEFRPTLGSYILNGPPDLALRNELQRRATEESRLGIPVIFGADVIHGYRTIFPIPLAQACAWSPELVQRACRAAAEEARAQGVDWTFAPMVDHCVDPRWGRIAETFGESPHLNSVLCVAAVEGYQAGPHGIASCLKHYVGYGASEGGRDYSSTEISLQRLWEMHLPPFEAGVRAGARTVMSAFNDLNGVPTSANHFTLTEILRTRWGFNGLVVSDWNAVLQLIQQGYAVDEMDAAQKALLAGVDLDMADGLYRKHLGSLVASGRVSIATLDEAVRRVLRVKFEQGLFERPFATNSEQHGAGEGNERLALAEEFAARSMVLLKNNGVLPLMATPIAADSSNVGGVTSPRDNAQKRGEGTPPTIAVRRSRFALIGPLAENRAALLGSWPAQGRPEDTPTIAEALRDQLGEKGVFGIERGCEIPSAENRESKTENAKSFEAAVALAGESDVVILCLGEEPWMSGENASRSSLRLPGAQEELALAIAATRKPIVLVIVSGRPVELERIEPHAAAILAAWQPGSRGAVALADILFGKRNPSGRLAITWPRTTGQIPIYHNMRPRARAGREGAYQDVDTSPQYEFGAGVSYTRFVAGLIRLSKQTVRRGETLVAEVTVANQGPRDGLETVMWFIRDPAASITRPLKELKHFEQALIPAGAERVFRFEISPVRDLSFPDADGRRVLEPGVIQLMVGAASVLFEVVL